MSAERSIDALAERVQTEAIAALESIYLDGPKNPYSGVCSNMWNALNEAFPGAVYNGVCDLYDAAVRDVIADWTLFSGEPGYPIPGGGEAYCAHGKTHTLWEGKQREYRMALIEYLQANLDCVGAVRHV